MNIIGRYNPNATRRIIIGTHYDTKKNADRGKVGLGSPVPGANDGASGVAVMLELASVMANATPSLPLGVDFIFFDGEEGEELPKQTVETWAPLGSEHFASYIRELYPQQLPIFGIVLDMVCDKNLVLRKEPFSVNNSASFLDEFWKLASSKYPRNFLSDKNWPPIMDDHNSLIKAGIPSFLLIDFEYPPFHTVNDTIENCSGDSLEVVADALLSYLERL
jgi:hypothetical protein